MRKVASSSTPSIRHKKLPNNKWKNNSHLNSIKRKRRSEDVVVSSKLVEMGIFLPKKLNKMSRLMQRR